MPTNNPFVKYKIYSSSVNYPAGQITLTDKTSIVCVIAASETDFKEFLYKILNAVKIQKDFVEIIALEQDQSLSAADLGWFEKLDYIFCFGIPVRRLHIQSIDQPYSRIKIEETTILQAPLLNSIESDQIEKQKLWIMLKNEFINE